MARYERLINDAASPLNGAINDTVTSITVDDGSVFPSEGDVRLQIDTETVIMTHRTTNTLTVVRGADGSTAASHSDNAEVRTVASAGQWDKVLDDLWAGASVRPPHIVQNEDGSDLVAADFSWVNQGTASLSDTAYGGLTMNIPADSGTDQRLAYISAPTAPWVFIGHFMFGLGYDTTSDWGSFMIRESASSKFYSCRFGPFGGTNSLLIQAFTSPTSGATNYSLLPMSENRIWYKIEDDNTDLTFSHSWDGVNWHEVFSHARGTFFTTGPDQIGLIGNGGGGSDWHIHISSFHFE